MVVLGFTLYSTSNSSYWREPCFLLESGFIVSGITLFLAAEVVYFVLVLMVFQSLVLLPFCTAPKVDNCISCSEPCSDW